MFGHFEYDELGVSAYLGVDLWRCSKILMGFDLGWTRDKGGLRLLVRVVISPLCTTDRFQLQEHSTSSEAVSASRDIPIIVLWSLNA